MKSVEAKLMKLLIIHYYYIHIITNKLFTVRSQKERIHRNSERIKFWSLIINIEDMNIIITM